MKLPRCLKIPRPPDFTIGQGPVPYMRRWWVIPRNRYFNIYLHHFLCSDGDRALHDHPWWNISIVLKGAYIEHMPSTFAFDEYVSSNYPHSAPLEMERRSAAGSIRFRRAVDAHRIELCPDSRGGEKPVWSLFITGPVKRMWGFHTAEGWKSHTEYLQTEYRD